MNIEDVEYVNQTNVVDPMKMIFAKQQELVEKYKEIEKMPSWPLNLDVPDHQKIIKDFKQRGMEEVAEAIEGFRNEEIEHFREELIDGLHFFVELNILSGKKWDSFSYYKHKTRTNVGLQTLYYNTGVLTEKYGLVMNTLKCKPWKQTHMPTDQIKFQKKLKEAFEFYIKFLHICGMTYDDIYNYYMRKHAVNQFRIRSNY